MPSAQARIEQLAEYLEAAAACCDETQTIAECVQRARAAVSASVAALVADGAVRYLTGPAGGEAAAASRGGVGRPVGGQIAAVRPADLLASAAGSRELAVDSAVHRATVVPVGALADTALVVARARPFVLEELGLLRSMAQLLGHSLAMQRALTEQEERSRLLSRLSLIQRSISHRAPLQEVLDAITAGAAELLGDPVAGIRLIDEADPDWQVLASGYGISERMLTVLRRRPVGEGVGGLAISEDRLVVIDSYEDSPDGLPSFRQDRLQAAMAAPVHSDGRIVGSLTVASYSSGRSYSAMERAALEALADHAGLALTDARTVAALREAEASKDLFLAMVSHELKTPLTIIMGTLRTLEQHGERLPDMQRREMLRTAYDRGRELERLIDGLLYGARGQLALRPAPTSLASVIADARSGLEGGDRVRVSAVPELELLIDSSTAAAVVRSLLHNALAHSPAGTPVSLAAATRGENVHISVRNAGALPAELPVGDLFKPFQRGEHARSAGVGLGLSVAARLARSLGGTITVDSAPDQVCFRLTFPLNPPPDPSL